MIDPFLILAETNRELIQLIQEQSSTPVLNPSSRHSQRFTKLFLFPFVAPVT